MIGGAYGVMNSFGANLCGSAMYGPGFYHEDAI
jgi:hypothetical protein